MSRQIRLATVVSQAACAELSHYRLSRLGADDADGYHRVACPAVRGSCRCPARPDSLLLSYERPTVISAPEQRHLCCVQKTITVPPEVNAKTAQKHPYPSPAHRVSYARRSAAERSNARLKEPTGINISVKGWCKLMGEAPLNFFVSCACVILNIRAIDYFEARNNQTSPPANRRRRRRALLAV